MLLKILRLAAYLLLVLPSKTLSTMLLQAFCSLKPARMNWPSSLYSTVPWSLYSQKLPTFHLLAQCLKKPLNPIKTLSLCWQARGTWSHYSHWHAEGTLSFSLAHMLIGSSQRRSQWCWQCPQIRRTSLAFQCPFGHPPSRMPPRPGVIFETFHAARLICRTCHLNAKHPDCIVKQKQQ